MTNAFQTRILVVVLAMATLAACVLAGFNMVAENNYKVPTDGIWWVEAGGFADPRAVRAAGADRFAGL